MILKNKGMYLETLINNSINRLDENNALIYKMPISNNILSVENNIITARLNKNYFCDYIGLWNGFYLEFEAKETEMEFFNLRNIKKHQLNKLEKVKNNKGIGFLLIYFHIYEKLFLLNISDLKNIKTQKIPFKYFQDNFLEIDISGIYFDFNILFNHLINYT
ncbi:Holliday junction resolvase RecU [Spiroplasma diminutum]|uniref:Holliday junction resolvase RecU n=1 Tax=Spiroplasma diminutum CUAS-1 TaxID=1276221 RepID=S5M1M1_9MOLU|nr:Holliday junction resolvase RecU [Spiroplasma diminutum]AGR41962.1 Holliday junction-specific endonuclease [Spiroplasma diminutum CUAS-1]